MMTADADRGETGNDTASAAPRIAVIIPHLNTPDLLARCLASITSQSLDHGRCEVIVVDNGSRVSLDEVKAAFPEVTFLLEPTPGPGLARNRGIAATRAPVLAFTDADCQAAPDWLQTAVAVVEAAPDRAVVGGDVIIETRDDTSLNPVEAFEKVFGFRQKMYIERLHFSVTANLVMSAAVARAVGPFADISIVEDKDWCLRARKAGFTVRYEPRLRVRHPAIADYESLTRKWRRNVHHYYTDHLRAGHPAWRWQLKTAMVVASIVPDTFRVLASRNLAGIGNRWRGVLGLARIRLFRAAEMMRAPASRTNSPATFWNR
ncbi:glycosyltransferase family 2 protein [Erythrobacter sp. NE805]|uniref:glycosyltransferase family 2 protein n=1 Tax=Erythrobacter sp. NE805 TaxID=3389875 RepID=UPI00396B1577